MNEAKMSFIEHLEELRKRLIICVVSIFVGMLVCWFFREQILAFLLHPLYQAWSQVDGLPPPKPLHFAGLIEPFVAYLKLMSDPDFQMFYNYWMPRLGREQKEFYAKIEHDWVWMRQ